MLVAGIGNVFFGDDGFGVAVAERLAKEPLPHGVRVEDFGIRGVHLAYELLNGYDLAILVDATPRGEAPGTVYAIEPGAGAQRAGAAAAPIDGHGMHPEAVLGLLETLGGEVDRVLVVGCEPAEVTERIGLSGPVAAAVGPAATMVRRLIREFSDDSQPHSGRRRTVGEGLGGEKPTPLPIDRPCAHGRPVHRTHIGFHVAGGRGEVPGSSDG